MAALFKFSRGAGNDYKVPGCENGSVLAHGKRASFRCNQQIPLFSWIKLDNQHA